MYLLSNPISIYIATLKRETWKVSITVLKLLLECCLAFNSSRSCDKPTKSCSICIKGECRHPTSVRDHHSTSTRTSGVKVHCNIAIPNCLWCNHPHDHPHNPITASSSSNQRVSFNNSTCYDGVVNEIPLKAVFTENLRLQYDTIHVFYM